MGNWGRWGGWDAGKGEDGGGKGRARGAKGVSEKIKIPLPNNKKKVYDDVKDIFFARAQIIKQQTHPTRMLSRPSLPCLQTTVV